MGSRIGGMGMNGGIHDAVNLTERLAAVWNDGMPDNELDRYDLQRRLATLESIQTQTIQNKKNQERYGPNWVEIYYQITQKVKKWYQ